MRPAMLLSAVVLWLKWEKPIYLLLSPRQWPFFCVQMLQCVDNIPVGFGGGLSQCWWRFDPPPPSPALKLTSRVAFRVYCRLAEEPVCRSSGSCSGSWIINPLTLPPQETTFGFFVRSHWLGMQRLRRHPRAARLDVCTFFASPNFLRTHPLPCSSLTSPLNNSAASLWEFGEGQWGTSLGWSVVVSVVRRGLGVREILVYRLHVFTFLMVSASFRACWKSKGILLFCLVMEKSRSPDEKSSFLYSLGLSQRMLG